MAVPEALERSTWISLPPGISMFMLKASHASRSPQAGMSTVYEPTLVLIWTAGTFGSVGVKEVNGRLDLGTTAAFSLHHHKLVGSRGDIEGDEAIAAAVPRDDAFIDAGHLAFRVTGGGLEGSVLVEVNVPLHGIVGTLGAEFNLVGETITVFIGNVEVAEEHGGEIVSEGQARKTVERRGEAGGLTGATVLEVAVVLVMDAVHPFKEDM